MQYLYTFVLNRDVFCEIVNIMYAYLKMYREKIIFLDISKSKYFLKVWA